MTRKARLWIGATLIIILAFNYGVIGMPLIRKAVSLNDKATTMLMAKVKSGHVLRSSSEEEYLYDIFRREKAAIDTKLVILNAVGITLLIIIASWTAFGLIIKKR